EGFAPEAANYDAAGFGLADLHPLHAPRVAQVVGGVPPGFATDGGEGGGGDGDAELVGVHLDAGQAHLRLAGPAVSAGPGGFGDGEADLRGEVSPGAADAAGLLQAQPRLGVRAEPADSRVEGPAGDHGAAEG